MALTWASYCKLITRKNHKECSKAKGDNPDFSGYYSVVTLIKPLQRH